MARAALKWSFEDLAADADISRMTVARFEGGKPVSPDSIEAMQNAFERHGVRFIKEGVVYDGLSPAP